MATVTRSASHLNRAWSRYRLALAAPERVPYFDVLVVTAGSPEQATLYRHQIALLRERGALPAAMPAVVVPDPATGRIGSGGATIAALAAASAVAHETPAKDRRTLIVHAGGESKRLPWASSLGKCFVPWPQEADPDAPLPVLLEHLMAIAAPAAGVLQPGSALILTGDVLPIFDAGLLAPRAAAQVVVTAAHPGIASQHGVIVPADGGDDALGSDVSVSGTIGVERLLQKPDLSLLQEAHALRAGAHALVDTGVIAFGPELVAAYTGLAQIDDLGEFHDGGIDEVDRSAANNPTAPPTVALPAIDADCSLYEDLLWPLLPSMHHELHGRAWGQELVDATSHISQVLTAVIVDDFQFVHLGTSAEFLRYSDQQALPEKHLTKIGHRGNSGRYLWETTSDAASISSAALIMQSRIGDGCRIGHRCLVSQVTLPAGVTVPAHRQLWSVPVRSKVLADFSLSVDEKQFAWCCLAIDEDPKAKLGQATLMGAEVDRWLQARHLTRTDLNWSEDDQASLWHQPIFPVAAALTPDQWTWFLGASMSAPADDEAEKAEEIAQWYQHVPRVSLAQISRATDFDRMIEGQLAHRAELAQHAFARTLQGDGERNLPALAEMAEIQLDDYLDPLAALPAPPSRRAAIPAARKHVDDPAWKKAFQAVADETAAAVQLPIIQAVLPAQGHGDVSMPVRIDLAGGWSDTPPFSLEHVGKVTNLAIGLNEKLPVRAQVTCQENADQPGVYFSDESGGQFMTWAQLAEAPLDFARPHALARAAVRLLGLCNAANHQHRMSITTSADTPRGSGLGTSSVVAAALVCSLRIAAGQIPDASQQRELTSRYVLAIEQALGTGGGWQDQVGGLYPGAKFCRSVPGDPLQLQVAPIPLSPAVSDELHQRLLVIDTGIQRLARNVLQQVVAGYLQRDRRIITSIDRLSDLAEDARDALAGGDLDILGEVMADSWRSQQELDPGCSNPAVDALMRRLKPYLVGAKLCGAGGGGFLVGMLKPNVLAGDLLKGLNGAHAYAWHLA